MVLKRKVSRMNKQYLNAIHYTPRVGCKKRELFSFLFNLSKISFLVSIIVFPVFLTGKRNVFLVGLLIGLIATGIDSFYNLYLTKTKGIMMAIDGHQMGLWAYSRRHHRMLYIPFKQIDGVKIRDQHLILQYQQSFIINEQRGPKIAGTGKLTYPLWIFSAKEADEFVKTYNKMVPKEYETSINLRQLKEVDHYKLPKMIYFAFVLFIVYAGTIPQTSSLMKGSSGQNSKKVANNIHHKDFKLNKTYESSDYRFKFLKAYRAKTNYGNPVGIVQVQLTAKRSQDFTNLPSVDFDSFKSATSEGRFSSEDDQPSSLVDYVVLNDGRGVVNQLHDGNHLRQAQRVVFNIVFELPSNKNKPSYLAYQPFSFDSGPDEYDDSTAIIWKIKPSELEELKWKKGGY